MTTRRSSVGPSLPPRTGAWAGRHGAPRVVVLPAPRYSQLPPGRFSPRDPGRATAPLRARRPHQYGPRRQRTVPRGAAPARPCRGRRALRGRSRERRRARWLAGDVDAHGQPARARGRCGGYAPVHALRPLHRAGLRPRPHRVPAVADAHQRFCARDPCPCTCSEHVHPPLRRMLEPLLGAWRMAALFLLSVVGGSVGGAVCSVILVLVMGPSGGISDCSAPCSCSCGTSSASCPSRC
ncbi:hypothetical protein QJS66_14515 [Kocuria rhizophila]|nr:hypothetical protein QJS66_14515 [Kocuria rhizophila]